MPPIVIIIASLAGLFTILLASRVKAAPMPPSDKDAPLPPNLRPLAIPVTSAMQQWAKSIVAAPDKYPYGAIALKSFSGSTIAARVEHHLWTMKDGVKVAGHYRGVTLYSVA